MSKQLPATQRKQDQERESCQLTEGRGETCGGQERWIHRFTLERWLFLKQIKVSCNWNLFNSTEHSFIKHLVQFNRSLDFKCLRDFQFFTENQRFKNKMADFAQRFFILFVRLETLWMYLLDLGDVSKGKKLFLDRLFISNSLLLPLIPESIWKSWNQCARGALRLPRN